MKITKETFNDLIEIEREAQDEKWGEQRHSGQGTHTLKRWACAS